jgi:low affinity Fe/Cu permease
VSITHPTDRGDEGRNWFDRFAEAGSNFTSSPAFFALCGLLIAAWALSYAFGASSELRDILGFSMTAVTLILLAVLKNAERRAEDAIQQKLDAIAAALLHERGGDSDAAQEDLQRAIGLHDEV